MCVDLFLYATYQVGIFGLYMLLAAGKGNFKFGARFMLIEVRCRGALV